MKFKLIIAIFIIFIFHTIEAESLIKYYKLNNQYEYTLPFRLYITIFNECIQQNVNLNMMIALSQKESGFKNIIGYTGDDIGYFQINRAHVKGKERFEDYFDLEKNVKKGISIYKSAFKKAKGDLRLALIYYNAGENFNPKDYSKEQEEKYINFILCNYEISNQADKEKIIIR